MVHLREVLWLRSSLIWRRASAALTAAGKRIVILAVSGSE
jgi:hypothetical protein